MTERRATRRTTPAERKLVLLLFLGAFFVANAIVAEMIGGKLFQVSLLGFTWTLSSGVLLWPVVFIVSDLVNEYFGRSGVRRLSLIAATMIGWAYIALTVAGLPSAASFSPIDDASFNNVFRQSRWIIVGSIVAFLVAQLLDVSVFWMIRRATGARYLWLRAQGSTVVSQLVDTFIVGFIGLHLPFLLYGTGYGVDFPTFVAQAISGYSFKFIVALAVTPLLYLGHSAIDRWLGEHEAEELVEATAHQEIDAPR